VLGIGCWVLGLGFEWVGTGYAALNPRQGFISELFLNG
jgi:hypothetical protein